MSLSVSYNSIASGIDAASVKDVAQQIFQKSSVKSVDLSTLDLTKFNKVSLGMDLYSGKVDSATARQIAMSNSSMLYELSEKTIQSVQYLNSEASKSVLKNVEGKIALPEVKATAGEEKTSLLPKFNTLIQTSDTGKDKNGSNPFYKGELLNIKKEKETEDNILV
jgi:hypothetical protein